MRGFNLPSKRAKCFRLLLDHQIQIGVLTETWLNSNADHSTPEYLIIKSPPASHQGVAIAVRRSGFDLVRLVHQDFHTRHTVAVKLRTVRNEAGRSTDLIVIGHYAQPAVKQECLEELRFFCENIQRDEPGTQMIIAGDLNSIQSEA